jgi:hypothetical protein
MDEKFTSNGSEEEEDDSGKRETPAIFLLAMD